MNQSSNHYKINRFEGATAWLEAYTRTPNTTNDGPPSEWSANKCASDSCPTDECECINPAGYCTAREGSTVEACANAALRLAVEKCLEESPVGNCTCANGCGGHYGPIGSWDVSLVTDMSYLFEEKSEFNGTISEWNTERVVSMEGMYANFY